MEAAAAGCGGETHGMAIHIRAPRDDEFEAMCRADGRAFGFTYSAEGPQHIELLEGEPGSIWDGRVTPGLHHIGVWSDDVAGETSRLVKEGWTEQRRARPRSKSRPADPMP